MIQEVDDEDNDQEQSLENIKSKSVVSEAVKGLSTVKQSQDISMYPNSSSIVGKSSIVKSQKDHRTSFLT